ncbi:hypothetical protein [Haloarchaeobius iranensis]|uniref:Uncharacterized protein n=1 Tax=Haloarchaeobius iranensis TaxID=996166 RepID=A0A1G9Z0W6_9EURY|nr:hypothetical protein [Haloarchaeobius iranensis]SDN14940.1 hypothetical protein SAMN05192554_11740 [Haloarchaeobius iranensis]
MSDETAGGEFDDALLDDLAATAVALDGTDPTAASAARTSGTTC